MGAYLFSTKADISVLVTYNVCIGDGIIDWIEKWLADRRQRAVVVQSVLHVTSWQ